MAKANGVVSALCILALATLATAVPKFDVEGDVYCDPCKVQFDSRLSTKLPGATVKLECFDIDTKAVTYSVEGVADDKGHYKLSVEGEHEKDICEVDVVKSPKEDCSEKMPDVVKARIVCTDNTGIHSAVRYTNPIGYMVKNVTNTDCKALIDELNAPEDN